MLRRSSISSARSAVRDFRYSLVSLGNRALFFAASSVAGVRVVSCAIQFSLKRRESFHLVRIRLFDAGVRAREVFNALDSSLKRWERERILHVRSCGVLREWSSRCLLRKLGSGGGRFSEYNVRVCGQTELSGDFAFSEKTFGGFTVGREE